MLLIAIAISGAADAGALRIWSYDPANAETRRAAGRLTFEFSQRLIFTTMLRVLATDAQATAELTPAKETALGAGGLARLIGPTAPQRDLYEIEGKAQGEAMIAAMCPGAQRGFLAFGRMRLYRDLRVFVLGENAGVGQARLCRTLDFNFHGDWRPPPGTKFDERQLERPLFPR